MRTLRLLTIAACLAIGSLTAVAQISSRGGSGGGSGGSGTVNSATSGDLGCYQATGTAISGCPVGNGLATTGNVLNLSTPPNDQSSGDLAIPTADQSELILVGPHTYTMPAAATAGNGWGVCLINIGSGTALINNSGDGATFLGAGGGTSLVIQPNGWACPTSNATNWDTSASPSTTQALIPTPITSNWYTLYTPSTTTTTSSAAATTGTTYCGSGVAGATMTVEALGVTVVGTGSTNLQLALYASGSWGRPGALMSNTGNILDTSGASVSGSLLANKQIVVGNVYWLCIQVDDTAATWRGYSSSARTGAALYGSATLGNVIGATSLDGVSVGGGTYGTWPNFTSGTSWTDDTGGRAPFAAMEAASAP